MSDMAGKIDAGLERLIYLSDGVFAIAITLLAIELHPPADWDGTFQMLMRSMERPFIAFVLSFGFIAIYWASHRRTYQRFKRSDAVLTILNFILLGLITLAPFFTSLIAEHGPHGEPLTIYFGLVAAIGVTNALQWGYASFIGRDILKHPMGAPLKLLIFLILLIVPTVMSVMGIVAQRPEYSWLYAAMGGLFISIILLRRHLGRHHDHTPL